MTRAPSGGLPIIGADERMKLRQGIKAVLAGPSGVGKTLPAIDTGIVQYLFH